jgi:PPOX class probable F420-dependent enzyme
VSYRTVVALVSPEARELLDGPNFAHLATLMHDGSPQVTPVWVELEGDEVTVNTAVGRVKDRNLRADGRVALSVIDSKNPYRAVAIRGRVIELVTGAEADRHIDGLAHKYLGLESYPYRGPGEERVKVRIAPDRVMLWEGRATSR